MAALTIVSQSDWTRLESRFEKDYVLAQFTATTTADATDEWIESGMDTVLAVVGYAVMDTATVVPTETPNFGINVSGTGGAANPGAIGVQTLLAQSISVTVIGTRADRSIGR